MDKIWKFSLLIAFIIIADQMTKALIEETYKLGEITPVINEFFNITYIKNTGAAFGLGANATSIWRVLFLLLIPVLACFYLLHLIWTSRKERMILGLSYSLIFAGAVGNLIDRFSLGYVVDFLDFFYKDKHFPAFNVADSCISIAAGLLVIDFFIEFFRKKPEAIQKESSPET